MTVTIYDVAREANVSMATVSRVVNGNPNVKPSTRKKVLEAIERLGYRPNAVARGLASKKTTTVGVIIPDISSIFFAELARGIEDIATMYKYNIILSNSDQNKEKELHLLNTMLAKQVDGLLFMGGTITEEHVAEFQKSSVPIVLAATIGPNEIPSVNIDYEQAAFEAVTYLLEKGNRRIVYVTGPTDDPINQRKLAGYRRALEEHARRMRKSSSLRATTRTTPAWRRMRKSQSLPNGRRRCLPARTKWRSASSTAPKTTGCACRMNWKSSVLTTRDWRRWCGRG